MVVGSSPTSRTKIINMTYLVKYTDEISRPGLTNRTESWEIIDEVCEGNSLLDINPYLIKKQLPILNDLTTLRINGVILVSFYNLSNQLYILDSEHKDCIQIVRDYKLKNILK